MRLGGGFSVGLVIEWIGRGRNKRSMADDVRVGACRSVAGWWCNRGIAEAATVC